MLYTDRRRPQMTIHWRAMALKGKSEYPKCMVPTMGLWSRGDVYLGEEQMTMSKRFMAAEWSYKRLERGSHWLQLGQPREVNRHLLAWLEKA